MLLTAGSSQRDGSLSITSCISLLLDSKPLRDGLLARILLRIFRLLCWKSLSGIWKSGVSLFLLQLVCTLFSDFSALLQQTSILLVRQFQ